MQDEDVPNSKEIEQFIGCGLCFSELPEGMSPANHSRLAIGFTKNGLQVWCERHKCNVINLDFEGKGPFPANTTRQKLNS